MKIFTSIQDYFKFRKAVRLSDDNLSHQDTSPSESQKNNIKNSEGLEPGLEFLDGMSTGTARFTAKNQSIETCINGYKNRRRAILYRTERAYIGKGNYIIIGIAYHFGWYSL
jgi:hypothetical protein